MSTATSTKEMQNHVLDSSKDNWCAVNILSLSWAATLATMTAFITSISIAVKAFSPSSTWNTMPLACMMLFTGVGQVLLPAKLKVMERQTAYLCGAAAGAFGCLIVGFACIFESFVMICIGCCLQGLACADGQNYRFGAMLLAPCSKEKVAGRVLFGGVLGSFIGPGAMTRARKLVPDVDFLGVFCLCIVMHALVFVMLCGVKFPAVRNLSQQTSLPEPRKLLRIVLQPVCCAAILSTTMSFVMMMFIMAPTPLVMDEKGGHSFAAASLTMMVHMVLMFAPSAMTAKALLKLGPLPVLLTGCTLIVICSAINAAGVGLINFLFSLGLLGVGWNFLFLSSTALLARSFAPNEGPKVQATADSLAAIMSGGASLASVRIIDEIGWKEINILDIGLALFTAVANLMLFLVARWSSKGRQQDAATGATPSDAKFVIHDQPADTEAKGAPSDVNSASNSEPPNQSAIV